MHQWTATLVGLITLSIGFIIFIRTLNKDRENAKEMIYAKIASLEKKHDEDIAYLIRSLSDKYVHTKICEIVHKSNDKSIANIECNITKIFEKLDELTRAILDGNKNR